ncbi:hypothetical protein ACVIHH_002949 [Bradyrhizobium sp. USDA 4518]
MSPYISAHGHPFDCAKPMERVVPPLGRLDLCRNSKGFYSYRACRRKMASSLVAGTEPFSYVGVALGLIAS